MLAKRIRSVRGSPKLSGGGKVRGQGKNLQDGVILVVGGEKFWCQPSQELLLTQKEESELRGGRELIPDLQVLLVIASRQVVHLYQ